MKKWNDNNNSVKCYEYFNNEDYLVIIMELCDNNLLQFLKEKISENGKGFNSEEIFDIMEQLNNTFKIMKENEIIIRDLKLENILIKYIDEEKKKYIIKLTDYGRSERIISLSRNCNTYPDTSLYMPSEPSKGKENNFEYDLRNIGILIYTLIYGESPYLLEKEIASTNKKEKSGNKMIKIENKKLNDLVERLLDKDAKEKIKWKEYFDHPFFKTKNIINLIYYSEEEEEQDIFGYYFVQNNIKNIELMINGAKSKLIQKYELNKGENYIQIIIKNEISNLKAMFENCVTLKNIDELKYLDTKEITDFSCMFNGCSSLSDIKSLENWNVENGTDFSDMFKGCSILSEIKSLKKWNVSNGTDFSSMFEGCSSLLDLKSLKNWNVSNGSDFRKMFGDCSLLSNIKSLRNWNVSKGTDFSFMFNGCSSLSDIKSLKNWNVSNGTDFSGMFYGCSSLSDITSLEKWNVSKGTDFSYIFRECSKLSDIKSLEKWNVSNGTDFSFMFDGCSSLSDIKSLENWKVSHAKEFSGMFRGCSSLQNLIMLEEKWKYDFRK